MALEGRTPTMHLVSTRRWWRLRGGAAAPTGPARSARVIGRGPGVEGRLAAMAESAPTRVRVLPAPVAGAFGMAELLAGAGLRSSHPCGAGGPGAPRAPRAVSSEYRPPPTTPGHCFPPLRLLPCGAGTPAPHTVAEKLLRGLFWVFGVLGVLFFVFLRARAREHAHELGEGQGDRFFFFSSEREERAGGGGRGRGRGFFFLRESAVGGRGERYITCYVYILYMYIF